MNNNKDRKRTAPGEKAPGKFHFNPGNMSGKDIQDKTQQKTKPTRKQSATREQKQGR